MNELDGFKIIKKADLNYWFKSIIDKHIQGMGYDMDNLEDVEELNKTLDEFSKFVFWGG